MAFETNPFSAAFAEPKREPEKPRAKIEDRDRAFTAHLALESGEDPERLAAKVARWEDGAEIADYLGHTLTRYLDRHCELFTQFDERLRRGVRPEALALEVAREIGHMAEGRAPFVDSEHLERRVLELQEEKDKLARHRVDHLREKIQLESEIMPLTRKGGLAPYEQQLLKKYQRLQSFLGDPIYGQYGHLADLGAQLAFVESERQKLAQGLAEARAIETILTKSRDSLGADGLVEVWRDVARNVGFLGEMLVNRFMRMDWGAAAAKAKERKQAIKQAIEEGVEFWLRAQTRM